MSATANVTKLVPSAQRGRIVFSGVRLRFCLSVCRQDNSWTVMDIIEIFTATSYGGKCEQVRKWLYRGARVVT